MMPPILNAIERAGHTVFTNGPYDLNLGGIRASSREAGTLDDLIFCAYQNDQMNWVVEWFTATVDPLTYYLEHPMKPEGCAILCEGQHRRLWILDRHRGQYPAYCQRAGCDPVSVYRDDNLDRVLNMDPSTIQVGMFNINMHYARGGQKAGAGCQVVEDEAMLERLLQLGRLQIQHHPTWTKFSYTLLLESQL